MKQRLDGKKVLVTRETKQAKEFSTLVKQAGGQPIEAPLIQIVCKQLPQAERDQLENEHYSWVFFTSANGVRCFFSQQLDVRKVFQTARIAAVGNKTANVLESYGYVADYIPRVFNAKTMMDDFINKQEHGGRWLLIRGNLSKNTIPATCLQYQIPFELAEVYETRYEEERAGHLQTVLNVHRFDFITFTSPSTVDSFCARIKKHAYPSIYMNTDVVCIGSTTMQRAKEAGFKRAHAADPFTTQGMIEKMIDLK